MSTPAGAVATRGSVAFLVTALLVHAGNYLLNLLLARQLGPADFAELNLVVTLLLLLTVVTHTVQLVSARTTAELDVTRGGTAALEVHRWVRRRAAAAGAVAGLVLVVGAPAWATLFHSPSVLPFVVFGVGMPWFVVLGADRGHLQGTGRFRRLAAVNVVEMGVRLVGGVGLVAVGLGVPGAVLAISASFVAAGLLARDRDLATVAPSADPALRRGAAALLGPSLTLLVGQIVIAHGDVLVVKASATPLVAGRYAALAVIGRVVFYLVSSLVEVTFPLVARRFHAGGDDPSLLRWSGLAVAGVGVAAVAVTAAWPGAFLRVLFGAAYAPVEPLLWRYTLATVLFSTVFVLASHGLARGDRAPVRLLAVGAPLQLAAVVAVRADLARVVDAQIAVMALLLAASLLVHARRAVVTPRPASSEAPRLATAAS